LTDDHERTVTRANAVDRSNSTKGYAMEMKLELVPVPVSDVDQAKAFYTEKLSFREDIDQRLSDTLRFVQLTPPGSACSIAIGEGITEQAPGSTDGLLMVVSDIQAACNELRDRGVELSDPATMPWRAIHSDFTDPDGNRWTLQQPAAM
jgi:catechol 2,3-dioxygenase-like lactoylglutathione lyase family enzyme